MSKPISKPKRMDNPFDQLLGVKVNRIPTTGSATLVVNGTRLTDKRAVPQLAADMTDDPDAARLERERLRKELERVRNSTRYQRDRQDPEAMAKRKAWADANKEERREYLRKWRKKNRARIRPLQADWSRRRYHQNPEEAAAKQRAYYAKNREAILARLAVKNAAKKAARLAEQASQADPKTHSTTTKKDAR